MLIPASVNAAWTCRYEMLLFITVDQYCCLILLTNTAVQNCCSKLLFKTAVQCCCSKLLFKTAVQDCCSSRHKPWVFAEGAHTNLCPCDTLLPLSRERPQQLRSNRKKEEVDENRSDY